MLNAKDRFHIEYNLGVSNTRYLHRSEHNNNVCHLRGEINVERFENSANAAGDVVDGDLAFRGRVTPASALVASVASDPVVRGLHLLPGDGTPDALDEDTATVSEAIRAARAGVALAVFGLSVMRYLDQFLKRKRGFVMRRKD